MFLLFFSLANFPLFSAFSAHVLSTFGYKLKFVYDSRHLLCVYCCNALAPKQNNKYFVVKWTKFVAIICKLGIFHMGHISTAHVRRMWYVWVFIASHHCYKYVSRSHYYISLSRSPPPPLSASLSLLLSASLPLPPSLSLFTGSLYKNCLH